MKISLFLAFALQLQSAAYRFEGVYPVPDGEERFFLVQSFIPYNPNVLAVRCDANAAKESAFWWPSGTFFREAKDRNLEFDFIWIGEMDPDLDAITSLSNRLAAAKAVYTPTRPATSYPSLKLYLESFGYTLISHWFWEDGEGHAIFLKKDIFDAAMQTLNCAPLPEQFANVPSSYNLKKHFRTLKQKSGDHSFGPIDFIYMINLDERPEKWRSASTGLALYGIFPSRFPAVNGWNLSLNAIQEVGVKFKKDSLRGHFLGSVYHEAAGKKCRSNEFIQEDGQTYFSMGLSQGSIGIVLSHLSVLQDAYDSGYQMIWVMEDDVEVVGDPYQIPGLIAELDQIDPNWDILFTDTDTKDKHGNHVPCRALAARPNFCTKTREDYLSRFYSVSLNLSRIGMRYGAYSMIVKRAAMKKILDYFNSYGIFLPYDMDFWLVPEIKLYTVTKDVVSHMAGAHTDNNLPHYIEP